MLLTAALPPPSPTPSHRLRVFNNALTGSTTLTSTPTFTEKHISLLHFCIPVCNRACKCSADGDQRRGERKSLHGSVVGLMLEVTRYVVQ